MGKVIRIPDETRQAVATDYLAGMQTTKIADKHNISVASVYNIIDEVKMNDLKEKEPTAAATATDSKEKISQVECITELTKSQALRGVDVLGVLEYALDSAYSSDAEIMSLRADSDTASIVFRYGGTAYSVQFGLAF